LFYVPWGKNAPWFFVNILYYECIIMISYSDFINESKNNIPAENQEGDCYVVGYQYFMKNHRSNPNLRLCHGLVTGQGPIKGIVYNHCWCEDIKTDNVIDMTMPECFQNVPTKVYYHIGLIDPDNVYKYDFDQVMEKAAEFKTYGPWEDKLLKNEY